MIIGVPKEIKNNENRVGLTPAGVAEFRKHGHDVYVQATAGNGSGFSDAEYEQAGATVLSTIEDVYAKAEMIVKVKEPIASEYPLIKENQLLFTYFHFASGEELTHAMIERKAVCLAYETVELPTRALPLLIPMSDVAGRMAPHLITRDMLKTMRPGTVLVDVAVDQGGCIETCKPTTHENPTFIIDDIVHYCVANMPGAVPYTSTLALTNATLPYAVKPANLGWQEACRRDEALRLGLNVVHGKVVYKGVADAWGLPLESVESVMEEAVTN